MPRSAALALLLVSAAGPLGGCIEVEYVRKRAYRQPPPSVEQRAIELGSHPERLGELFELLGAPEIVWAAESGGDVVLAWAWQDQEEFGINVSYTIDRFASASFDGSTSQEDREAIVCVLDPELQIRSVRRGVLRDLIPRSALQNPER